MCYYVRYVGYVGKAIMQYLWLKVKWWLMGLSRKEKGKFLLIPFVWSVHGPSRYMSLVLVLLVNIGDENYASQSVIAAFHLTVVKHFICV